MPNPQRSRKRVPKPDGRHQALKLFVFWLGIFLLLVGFAPIDSVHAETCVSSTSTVRGEPRAVHTRHPNGTPIEAFQLVFRPSICVADLLVGNINLKP
jgi:hypothetical protein